MKNRTTIHSIDNNVSAPDTKNVLIILFVKGFNNRLCRNLTKFKIDVLFPKSKKLSSIIRMWKNELKIPGQTELVYKINGMDCDVKYIGQIKRHLETPTSEYRNDIKRQAAIFLLPVNTTLHHCTTLTGLSLKSYIVRRISEKKRLPKCFLLRKISSPLIHRETQKI